MIRNGVHSLGTRTKTFVDKYLPLTVSVSGLTARALFMEAIVNTANGWFFLVSLFSFFYAVFFYRWVTTKPEHPKEDGT